MWVHLATKIARVQINLGLVNEADDLDIGRCFRELDALKSTGRDEAGASAWFGAPCNHFSFFIRDELVRVGGSP